MQSDQDLRIGVIGVVGRGRLAHQAHQPGKGSRIVAGADIYPDALAAFTKEIEGARPFNDYRPMLDEMKLDAVFVTSPDYMHEEHAVAALQRGIAVYLEKPMAITIEGCDRILAAAAQSGARLYVGHNMRHMSFVKEMKRLIDSGAIGEVKAAWCRHFIGYGGDAYFKDWHSERKYTTGLLLQKAAHDIDVMHWLCGGFTEQVVAMGALTLYDQITSRHPDGDIRSVDWGEGCWPPLAQKNLSPHIDVEDLNHVLMRLDNGVMMTYQQCHYTPDSWRNYTFIGTEGRIENIGDEPGKCEIRLWNHRADFTEKGDQRFPIPPVEGGHGGADPHIVNEFLRYVRDGAKIITDPLAARAAVAAGVLATESLRSGSIPKHVPPVRHEAATPRMRLAASGA